MDESPRWWVRSGGQWRSTPYENPTITYRAETPRAICDNVRVFSRIKLWRVCSGLMLMRFDIGQPITLQLQWPWREWARRRALDPPGTPAFGGTKPSIATFTSPLHSDWWKRTFSWGPFA